MNLPTTHPKYDLFLTARQDIYENAPFIAATRYDQEADAYCREIGITRAQWDAWESSYLADAAEAYYEKSRTRHSR